MTGISIWKLLLFLGVILLLFSSRLPTLARSLGQSVIEFKKGLKELESSSDDRTDPKSWQHTAVSETAGVGSRPTRKRVTGRPVGRRRCSHVWNWNDRNAGVWDHRRDPVRWPVAVGRPLAGQKHRRIQEGHEGHR